MIYKMKHKMEKYRAISPGEIENNITERCVNCGTMGDGREITVECKNLEA